MYLHVFLIKKIRVIVYLKITIINLFYQKNIYLGKTEKVEKVLNWYNDEKKFNRSDNQIKNQTTIMLLDFFVPHLNDGWEKFTSNNYSLEKVIYPYLKKIKK